MRIGIVTDIHEEVEPLARALDEFRRRGVDVVVNLGDTCDTYSGRIGEVVALLKDANAVGVWGNHDIGLCIQIPEQVRRVASPHVLEYMAGMQPQMVVEGFRFSHVEPWLDALRVEDIWYVEGPPDTPELIARSFAAVPERHLFVGHFHRWLIMTPLGKLDWNGEGPISLRDHPRSLTVVAPVFSGWCAIFDTAADTLTPIRCAP